MADITMLYRRTYIVLSSFVAIPLFRNIYATDSDSNSNMPFWQNFHYLSTCLRMRKFLKNIKLNIYLIR